MMGFHPNLTGRQSTIAAISIAFELLFCVNHTYAQNATAESLFIDGNKLMIRGKFAEACAAFEASNRIEPRAGTLLRLGDCREQTQQLASAWSAYKDARSAATDSRKRQYATAKVTALEKRLSQLTVSVSDKSQIPGLALTRNGSPFAPALWNRPLPVDGDDYVITARAPGYDTWKKIVHVPVAGAKLRVDVPVLTKAVSGTIPEQPASPAPSRLAATTATPLTVTVPVNNVVQQNVTVAAPQPSIIVVPAAEHAPASPQASNRTALFVVGAGALALLGSGLGLELWAESRYDVAKAEMMDQARRDALYHSANTDRHVALAFAGTGVAAAATATWLYLRTANHERSPVPATSTHLVPTATGISLIGQF